MDEFCLEVFDDHGGDVDAAGDIQQTSIVVVALHLLLWVGLWLLLLYFDDVVGWLSFILGERVLLFGWLGLLVLVLGEGLLLVDDGFLVVAVECCCDILLFYDWIVVQELVLQQFKVDLVCQVDLAQVGKGASDRLL